MTGTAERQRSWRKPLAAVVLIVLFIPIKRYTLPSSLPVNLEIYRIAVALVLFLWLGALLVDSRVRCRASRIDAPLVVFLLAIFLSQLANLHRVAPLRGDVIKATSFFLSYIAFFYLVVSVVRRSRDIDFLARILAAGGAVVGVCALVETGSGFNVFNHLHTVLPFLHSHGAIADLYRGGGRRAYASAQHPIALGAAFCVLLPLAVYRAAAFRQRRWWVVAGLIAVGVLATRSRTPIVMLGVEVLVYAVLRTREMKRVWPAFIPVVLVAYVALPGSVGAIKNAFFPTGGLVAQQTDARVGSGRLATLGPAFQAEFKPHPLFGEGFGTRITTPDSVVTRPNAPTLDDEWLGVLLETGVAGALALAWFFVRSIRRLGREAKNDASPRGWLLTAVTASTAAYAVGMFFYDAFSFVQVTFLLLLVLGLGASAALSPQAEWAPEALASRRRRAATLSLAPARGQLA